MYPVAVSLSAIELNKDFGALLDRVELLRDRTNLSELSGGLTNRNLKVETPHGNYVARISSNESDLLAIDRKSEYANSKLAAEVNIGAPVYEYLPGDGLLVIGFLPGHTYGASDVAANLSRIAESCRTLHSAKPFVRDFNMFDVQRFRMPELYGEYTQFKDLLQKAFSTTDTGKVPCNNDLLPANFIDDGSKIWLIDYEYSGNNDPCFELGNIWSEAGMNLEQLRELVTAYYGGERPDKFARAWLFSVLAKYGWTLWASIQDSISELDFDFWGWGMAKYEDVQRDFTSDFFKEQIALL